MMTIRDIDNDDTAWINAQTLNGLALLARYQVAEPQKVSPAKIATAMLAWRCNHSQDRPEKSDAFRAFGCLLGHQYAVDAGGGKWVVVSDNFGTSLGIQRESAEWVFFPLDVVSKRMTVEPAVEIISAYDVWMSNFL